jgi:hypothetical protein
MSHRLLLFCVSLLGGSILALSPAAAAAGFYGISGAGKDPRGLSVADGEVRWTTTGERDWRIDRTAKGYTLRAGGGKWQGWYLSYDPERADQALFLSERPTAGSYWGIGTIDRPTPTRMWAAAGQVSGRYLNLGPEDAKIKEPSGDKIGKPVDRDRPRTANRVTLSGQPLDVVVSPIAP